MVDVATLGLAVKFDQVDRASGSLDKFSGAAGRAEKSAQGMGKGAETAARKAAAANDNAARSADKAAAAYGKWHTVALRMARALGAIGGTLATAAVFRYADAWSDMQSRVGAAVKDMEAAPALMQRMVEIANASYSPLDQTVEVYSRNVAVLRDLGKGATEAADFTEALNHALVLTATRGERAASVQNALSKAMAVGKLQAEGLETILANGGEVAQVLADKMGTTVSGLRGLASQGKITGDVIATALIGRLDDLRDRAGEMPATIGDAFTRLTTNLTAFIGQMDQATGASQRVSEAIMLVADNIDVIARVAAVAGVAMALYFGPAALGAIAFGLGYVGAAGVAAMTAIKAAVMANPIGFLVTALTTAVTAAYLFRDEIQQAIGVDVIGIVKTAANYIIGSFVAAYEDIKFVWGNFGNIMGAAVIGGVNIAIKALNSLAASAKVVMNDLIGAMNMIPGVNIGTFDVSSDAIGQIDNPYAKRLEGAIAERNAAIQSALSRDYIGELGEIVFGTKSATEATEAMAGAVSKAFDPKAAKEAEKLAKAYDKIVLGAQQFIDKQLEEMDVYGMTEQAANAYRYELDLLQQAQSAGIKLTEGQRDQLRGLAEDMAATEAAAKALKEVNKALEEASGQFGGILRGLLDGTKNWKDALLDLIPIVLKLLNTMQGGKLFGGGIFQSFIGGLLGVQFAKGGAFQSGNIIPFAKGGVVNKPTVFPFAKGIGLMGEAGPEAIMPLRRGADGRLGVSAPRSAANDQPLRLEIVSRFDADGGFESAVERSSRPVAMQESAKAAGQVARAVPSMALGAMDNSRTRRTRTISPGGGL